MRKRASNKPMPRQAWCPTRDGYINAIQVWPFSDGALYQVYTSPGRVTVISLHRPKNW